VSFCLDFSRNDTKTQKVEKTITNWSFFFDQNKKSNFELFFSLFVFLCRFLQNPNKRTQNDLVFQISSKFKVSRFQNLELRKKFFWVDMVFGFWCSKFLTVESGSLLGLWFVLCLIQNQVGSPEFKTKRNFTKNKKCVNLVFRFCSKFQVSRFQNLALTPKSFFGSTWFLDYGVLRSSFSNSGPAVFVFCFVLCSFAL
jgi:hypothetical protein